MARTVRNPFTTITLSILWWPVVVLSFIVVYYLLEDYLERYLNLPRIYHRRRLSSIYIILILIICFPETVYDLLMVGVDLVLFAWNWLASFYLDLSKWLIQFWIQIEGFLEMQPKEIPIYTIVGWNSSIFSGRVKIRIVVSIDPETFVTTWKRVRPLLVWLKVLIKKLQPFALYLYRIWILIFSKVFLYFSEGYKLFHKYLWPRDFRVLINRILFFKFLEKTLLPICRALWNMVNMVKYWKRDIIDSLHRIWKKIREFLFW